MAEWACPALGRIASIGTLYDAKSDRFLHDSILPDQLPPGYVSRRPESRTEVVRLYRCTSYESAFKALQIDEQTAVNILSGLVETQGATIFLRDFIGAGGTLRGVITHDVSTARQTLGNFGEAFRLSKDFMPLETNDCTHVVTGISWGLQTVITATYSTSNSLDPIKDENAFDKDMEALKFAIESANFSPQSLTPAELSKELIVYSDVLQSEGLVMQDEAELCDFIRLMPDHINQGSNGKGWPISYTMIPIAMLTYFVRIPGGVQGGVRGISPDILTSFIRLFEDFDVSTANLRTYHTYLVGNSMHVTDSHIEDVVMAIKALEDNKKWTTNELRHLMADVMKGEKESVRLLDLYHHIASGEFSPSCLSAIAGQETNKLEFIRKVIAQGATYIGHNGVSLEMVKQVQKGAQYHVFHFDSESMNQHQEWDDNCALLLELLGRQDQQMPVYIADYDAVESDVNLEAPRISQYDSGKETIPDVLANRQYLATKCFARYDDDGLDTSDHPRPIKRCFVKIPCPCKNCDFNEVEWTCPTCLAAIEYGFTDSFFYCDCGRSMYSSYNFRCNHPKHGPRYMKYNTQELHKLLNKLNQADYINILILGETGVGKSSFINAFVNYLSFSTLEEAKEADGLATVIPCSFSLQTMDRDNPETGIQEYNVKVGTRDDEVDGSTGASATQKTAVYPVTIGTKTYRLIDTPGIGDTRGLSFDKKNMADILATISSYDELHGILILLKSNNSRLTITFRFCVKELLAHLHRSAAASMAFGFTNTRISNYTPGDTFKPLKSLLEEHSNVGIALSTSTMYCFDSESFRYLAACKQNVPVANEEDFRRSWDHSRKEALRLLNYFTSTPPHPVTSTLSLNGTRKLISELTTPMARISESVMKNIALYENQKMELNDTKLTALSLRSRLHLEKIQFVAKKLDRPRTVCRRVECCDFKDSGKGDGEVVAIYKTHCHPICYLDDVKEDVVADPGLINCAAFSGSNTCQVCGHRWQEHLHVLYELDEVRVRVKDKEIERQLEANSDDVTLRKTAIIQLDKYIGEYKDELNEIRRAAAHFCLFLRENAITPVNDATLEYIEMLIMDEKSIIDMGKQRSMPMEANQKRLEALEADKQAHIQLVETLKQNMLDPKSPDDRLLDEQGVDAMVKKLYTLKHFGSNLRDIKYVIDSSLEGTYRERPFRVRARSPRRSSASVKKRESHGRGSRLHSDGGSKKSGGLRHYYHSMFDSVQKLASWPR